MLCKQEAFDAECAPEILKIILITPLTLLFPDKPKPKGSYRDVIYEDKKAYNNSCKTIQNFYINIDMMKQHSWAGISIGNTR
jgi:hypothetical protein